MLCIYYCYSNPFTTLMAWQNSYQKSTIALINAWDATRCRKLYIINSLSLINLSRSFFTIIACVSSSVRVISCWNEVVKSFDNSSRGRTTVPYLTFFACRRRPRDAPVPGGETPPLRLRDRLNFRQRADVKQPNNYSPLTYYSRVHYIFRCYKYYIEINRNTKSFFWIRSENFHYLLVKPDRTRIEVINK